MLFLKPSPRLFSRQRGRTSRTSEACLTHSFNYLSSSISNYSTNLNFAWIRLSQLYLNKMSARGAANEELRRDIMRALSEQKEKFIDVFKKPMVWLILAIFLGLSIGLIATHNQLSSVRKELVTCQKMNPNGCHGSFRGKFPFKMPGDFSKLSIGTSPSIVK